MNKPECITLPNGTKVWYLNDKLHREDGPAVERSDGDKEWWLNDKLHREDGPAITRSDGTKQWWLNGSRTHPETLVDLWLEREVFCWYDETNNTLNFGENND
jgi:hypothetical protein